MHLKTIRDLDVKGKKVLVRVDYNVPLSSDGSVGDIERIEDTLPTLHYLLDNGASAVLMSHLGRPKGKPDPRYSLYIMVNALESLIRQKVEFAPDCVGAEAEKAANALRPGSLLLLENLRFHPEEEANDESFAKALASLGDLYVNDAFGASHRAHASIVGPPNYKPAAAGFLMEKEIKMLSPLLENPQHPYLAILGGAKISDKLAVVRSLLKRVDALLIGGAMAFTFLKAQGYSVGASLVEDRFLEEASKIMDQFPGKIKLPVDCIAAPSIKLPEQAQELTLSKERGIIGNLRGLDIGPRSIEAYARFIEETRPRTVFWNGPMGVFEIEKCARGTYEIAKVLGKCAKEGAKVIVGGGDSIAALKKLGLAHAMTHLSTGGGASLEFLEGKMLPGIAALLAASSASQTSS